MKRFCRTHLLVKHYRLMGQGILLSFACFFATLTCANAQPDTNSDVSRPKNDDTTIVYGEDFISQYPNATSVLDLIHRIPGGDSIIASGANSSRGFATNDDRILIDGKRLTGKSNDSESALERITVDQVKQIEVIRGASPDIKTSGPESLINIVLKSDKEKNSGTWKADTEIVKGAVAFGGLISYSGSASDVGYQISVKRFAQRRSFQLVELQFSGSQNLDQIKRELDRIKYSENSYSLNLNYSLGNDHQFSLNGLYSNEDYSSQAPGALFSPEEMVTGHSERSSIENLPKWEIGGDYEGVFSDRISVKLLGLYSDKKWEMFFGEDLLITGETPADDFQFTITQLSTEAILRPTAKWRPGERQTIEFGTEFAVNTLHSKLNFFERVNGSLSEVPIPGGDTTIKETRDESFLRHTYRPGAKLSIETGLTAEYSKIEQAGDIFRERDFFFLKPSIDLRYNLTSNQQFQVSALRNVAQLQFGDFAASANDDTKTFGGNSELVPEKEWKIQLSYENRFKEDAGRIQISTSFRDIQDRIELLPLTDQSGDTFSAVGNVGDATIVQLDIEGSLRLKHFNMPNFIVEPKLSLSRSRVTDPFSGERTEIPGRRSYYFRLETRHDHAGWGLSYGGTLSIGDESTLYDIDERSQLNGQLFMSVFAEYQILKGITLRAEANDLTNFDRGRNRLLFANGRAGGVVTSRELLEKREGRVYNLSLRGNF